MVVKKKRDMNLMLFFSLSTAGLSLRFKIQGCQTPNLHPKTDLKLHFGGYFRCLPLNRRVPKDMFQKLMGAMAPVAPVLTGPLHCMYLL